VAEASKVKAERLGPSRGVPEDLLTRLEAAHLCRVSDDTFDRHIRPALSEVRVGSTLRFYRDEVEAWRESHRAGGSSSEARNDAARSSSGIRASAAKSKQGQERLTLRQLRNARRRSTPRQYGAETTSGDADA